MEGGPRRQRKRKPRGGGGGGGQKPDIAPVAQNIADSRAHALLRVSASPRELSSAQGERNALAYSAACLRGRFMYLRYSRRAMVRWGELWNEFEHNPAGKVGSVEFRGAINISCIVENHSTDRVFSVRTVALRTENTRSVE